jgi:GT2 family glycosyltransferase
MSKFSVGLVVYKTDVAELKRLFDLLAQECFLSQMFVFDNGGDEQLKNEVLQRGWRYLSCGDNIGFGAGHNRILSELGPEHGEFHWIVNPDLEWDNSPTAEMADYLTMHPKCGAVMPDVLNLDGSRQYLAKSLPTPMILLGRRFFANSKKMQALIRQYEMRDQSYDEPFESPLISGCCFFTRQSLVRDIKGFDERYFLYLEDYDLCRKIWCHGYLLAVLPFVQVKHGHGRASYQFGRALWLHIRSACKYFNKWGWLVDRDGRPRL